MVLSVSSLSFKFSLQCRVTVTVLELNLPNNKTKQNRIHTGVKLSFGGISDFNLFYSFESTSLPTHKKFIVLGKSPSYTLDER